MRRALIGVLCTGLGVAGLAACADLLGFERLEASAPVAEAGLPDVVASDAGVDADDPRCAEIGIPPLPDSGSGGGSEYWFATSIVDFGLSDDAGVNGGLTEQTGFNLDRRCTTSPATSSCIFPPNAVPESYQLDKGALGVDNAGYRLLQSLSGIGTDRPFAPGNINARLRQGKFNLVFRLSAYNDTPNDRDVTVNYFPAVGIANRDGGPPSFDRTDEWLLDDTRGPGKFDGLSIYQDINAYVTNGTLVARFPRLPVSLDVSDDQGRLTIWLSDLVIVGTLRKGDGGAPVIDRAIASGRWGAEDFLREVGTLTTSGFRVCDSPPIFDTLIKATYCPALDLRATGTEDNTGKPCDAISAVLVLSGYNVNEQSRYVTVDAGPNPCLKADLTCPTAADAGAD